MRPTESHELLAGNVLHAGPKVVGPRELVVADLAASLERGGPAEPFSSPDSLEEAYAALMVATVLLRQRLTEDLMVDPLQLRRTREVGLVRSMCRVATGMLLDIRSITAADGYVAPRVEDFDERATRLFGLAPPEIV